ncbi:MAG: hypothetical protein FWE11_04250 [Defluviitaleaceae bacterium]|nr:hypothetical protein [Defluviitaleaceae bacterium]
MTYTIDKIKEDAAELSSNEFYMKHILRSDNWYFEKLLGKNKEDSMRITDDFKTIVSQSLDISFNNIAIVGSSKTGCSLAPTKKLFRCFNEESDIDIAIVSDSLFHRFWKLFRDSYSETYKRTYNFIKHGIYRGYINEKNLDSVDGCRKEWDERAIESKKLLKSKLFVKHEITYRLYRSWEDFEEYHIQSIDEIKRGEI